MRDWGKAHNYPFMHSTSVTLNIAKDPELLKLLKEARFKYPVGVAVDSAGRVYIADQGNYRIRMLVP